MASQDMTNALKQPHSDVSFATIGDGTLAPTLSQKSPGKAAERKCPAAKVQPVLR
jgi:hypothetical protein